MRIRNLFLSSILFLFSNFINAQVQYDVYAGFMLHFGKFVQWPAEQSSGDFVIGVVGDQAIKSKLEGLASTKNINGRKIVIRKVAGVGDLEGCHVLFVSKGEATKITTYYSSTKTHKILLVSEGDGNLSKGSVFNFIEKDGKIRFEYSQSEAEAHGLKVSADLVKLAIQK